MYESPFKTIQKGVEEHFEDGVMKVICQMGIDVNREELIKALQYDRDQYNKGYKDGYRAGKFKRLGNNKVHLCDSCEYLYPDCPCGPKDVLFGGGEGHDNIGACAKYKPKAAEQRTGRLYRYTITGCLYEYIGEVRVGNIGAIIATDEDAFIVYRGCNSGELIISDKKYFYGNFPNGERRFQPVEDAEMEVEHE